MYVLLLLQSTRKHFKKVVRYAKFAAATYGYGGYIHSKGLMWCLPSCLHICISSL